MAKKQKRLTQRERAERAAIKKQLQADGILPPDKPRLNRGKFARETWEAFEAFYTSKPIRAELSLIKAIGFMVGPDMKKVTPEEVGVFKLLKLAVEYDAFLKKLETEGRTTYNYGELIDKVILPITNL
ncbi:addiction module toxin RelE [uncultured Oscillibacter sp.]|uniref:addiction module toxin RelE n=1 Tax=uncultured Oscillibacter sp. TaxID=876091 RepID=UPI0025E7E59F|nr:addiction module toxin RelE [uncultured Oscillibacter sp.]